jgi:hypothetical protein
MTARTSQPQLSPDGGDTRVALLLNLQPFDLGLELPNRVRTTDDAARDKELRIEPDPTTTAAEGHGFGSRITIRAARSSSAVSFGSGAIGR